MAFGSGGVGFAVSDSYALYGTTPGTRVYCVADYVTSDYIE